MEHNISTFGSCKLLINTLEKEDGNAERVELRKTLI